MCAGSAGRETEGALEVVSEEQKLKGNKSRTIFCRNRIKQDNMDHGSGKSRRDMSEVAEICPRLPRYV